MNANRKLTVLMTEGHGLRFNSPRVSRHQLVWKRFPYNWKWRPLDGVAFLDPRQSFDLLHSFNQIPFTRKPWIVSFESILPRTIGKGEKALRVMLRERLFAENCRKIIAISEYARRKCLFFNRGQRSMEDATRKMEVIYPNLPLRTDSPKSYSGKQVMLLFVGNDFARKGGVVALRLAKKARKRRLPITVHIISKLQGIGTQYTDYPDSARYSSDLELLRGENVIFHGTLSNCEVVTLMARSHFQLLATIDDTFGFSVLEGFSAGTPCMATRVCALPEIITPGVNGHLLSMPTDENGNWIHLRERSWEILNATYSRLADEALDWLETFLQDRLRYEALSAGAIARVREHHDAASIGDRLDAIYSAAAYD